MSESSKNIEQAFNLARQQYADWGVDVDRAMQRLSGIAVSLHCWQGDDVGGFENAGEELGGGLAVTGNYPGKARTPDELRGRPGQGPVADPRHAPPEPARLLRRNRRQARGPQRNEPGAFPELDRLGQGQRHGHGFQSHLFLPSQGRRRIHARASRRGHPPLLDRARHRLPADRGGNRQGTEIALRDQRLDSRRIQGHARGPQGPAERLAESLDAIFAEPIDPKLNLDSVESKLFGIGSESYVVGSHEFYLGYAVRNRKLLCLDAGHFHPTEVISDKLSSVLAWLDEILLHVSRGIRWDSDHVVTLTDELMAIAQELVRGDFLNRVHIGLDYFDASINRVAAWVIGARSMLKALLAALLEPIDTLTEGGKRGRFHLPAGAAGRTKNPALGRGVGLLLPEGERPVRTRLAGRSEKVRKGRVVETLITITKGGSGCHAHACRGHEAGCLAKFPSIRSCHGQASLAMAQMGVLISLQTKISLIY